MRETYQDRAAMFAALVGFVAGDLVPALLRSVGLDGPADELDGADRPDERLAEVVGRAENMLRCRVRALPPGLDARRPEPLGKDHAHAVSLLRALPSLRDLVARHRDFTGLNDAQVRDDQDVYVWRNAENRLRALCVQVAHLPAGRTGLRARMLASNVRWELLDHLDGLDDASAARACRLAEVNAFAHTRPGLVFGAAAAIDDATCDVACAVLSNYGVWVDTVLDAAQALPLAEFAAAQRLYAAAHETTRRDRSQRPPSSESLLRDALAAAARLDEDAAELAVRLVASGLGIAAAADASRAAVTA